MKNIFTLLLLLTFLASCNDQRKFDFNGSTQVYDNFELFQADGSLFALNEGEHTSNLKFISRDMFELKTIGAQGEKVFSFTYPRGVKVPSTGSLILSAEQVSQPYNLFVEVNTSIVNSRHFETWESCSYQVADTCCVYGPYGPNCYPCYRTVFGTQNVYVKEDDVNRKVSLSFYNENTENPLAKFLGEAYWVDRHEDRGMCR